MFSIYMPYRPELGECIAQQTDLVRAIRHAASDEKFITWRNSEGQWVVSYVFGDGMQVDVGFAGSGERPDCARGIIDSMVSMVKAGAAGKGPIREAQRALASKNRAFTNNLIDRQRETLEYRKYLRRHSGAHLQDHPLVRPR